MNLFSRFAVGPIVLAVLSGTLLVAQEEVAAEIEIEGDARLLGEVADGTPTPTARPVERPPLEVIDTFVHPKGECSLVIQKVVPPHVPPALRPSPPLELTEEELEALLKGREAAPETRVAMISATVYDHEKTLVRWWVPEDRARAIEPRSFEAWSNLDFRHLGGFVSFEFRGIKHMLIMGVGAVDTNAWRQSQTARVFDLPISPDLPVDRPAYVVTEGEGSDAEGMAVMDGLHALYAKEKDRLVAAYEGREHARKERAAWLLANPPQSRDTVLHYSFGTRPLPQAGEEGGAE
jgi:hypothetical protein